MNDTAEADETAKLAAAKLELLKTVRRLRISHDLSDEQISGLLADVRRDVYADGEHSEALSNQSLGDMIENLRPGYKAQMAILEAGALCDEGFISSPGDPSYINVQFLVERGLMAEVATNHFVITRHGKTALEWFSVECSQERTA